MKRRLYLACAMAAALLIPGVALADPAPTKATIAADAQPASPGAALHASVTEAPPLNMPRLVPYTFEDVFGRAPQDSDDAEATPPKPLTEAEIAAEQKEAELMEENRNWLLRGYEEEEHKRSASSPDQNTQDSDNMLYRLSSNKELAKLAGLPYIDPSSQKSKESEESDASPVAKQKAKRDTASDDAFSSAKASQSPDAELFKPIVGSFSSPNATRAFAPSSSLAPELPTVTIPELHSALTGAEKPETDLDTPGMTAAKDSSDPAASDYDLTLGLLPGETVDEAKAREASELNPQLQTPMDESELHKSQDKLTAPPQEAPELPGAALSAPTAAAPPSAPTSQDSVPTAKPVPLSPVRGPIANPYDILNR